jgi:hypothetical protein
MNLSGRARAKLALKSEVAENVATQSLPPFRPKIVVIASEPWRRFAPGDLGFPFSAACSQESFALSPPFIVLSDVPEDFAKETQE